MYTKQANQQSIKNTKMTVKINLMYLLPHFLNFLSFL
nr:MAG TPA: hypothetical protein [Caudoviricetes sp.]